MKLSRHSWHYWLYSHTYPTYPVAVMQNFLVYILSIVFALIVFVPMVIFHAKSLFDEMILVARKSRRFPIFFDEEWLWRGFIGNLRIAAIYFMTTFFWHISNNPATVDFHFMIGLACWLINITMFLCRIEALKKWVKNILNIEWR